MTATSSRPSNQRVSPLRKPQRQLPFPLNLYQTAVGKKWVMALTGLGLIGFVLFHMFGNFKVYLGGYAVNTYGESLRDLGGHLVPRTHLLWIMRFGLLGMFGLHIHSAVSLANMGRASNPRSNMQGEKRYAGGQDFIAANFASRTMRWTGPIIALYIVFHLADLTWGIATPYEWRRGDVYHNLSESLSFAPVAIIYMVATLALSIHLFHGVWSMFQSLGINSPKYNSLRRGLAAGIAGVVLVGNMSLPIAALTGVIDTDKAECYEGIHEFEGQCTDSPVAEHHEEASGSAEDAGHTSDESATEDDQ